jgi:ribosomal protein S18 acetylase RimI-like enzyme
MREVNLYDNCLTATDFILLRQSAGWGILPKLQIEQALKNGIYSVVAKHGDNVVGMGRLVGDGIMYWYIQDVIILPEYQGKNIGNRIIEKLLKYAEVNSLSQTTITIGLMSAKGKEGFYKKFDFIERPNDAFGAGMIKKITID